MYFEPSSKKTYYRFPSTSSINDLDLKNYFPDKPHASGEDSRYSSRASESNENHNFTSKGYR